MIWSFNFKQQEGRPILTFGPNKPSGCVSIALSPLLPLISLSCTIKRWQICWWHHKQATPLPFAQGHRLTTQARGLWQWSQSLLRSGPSTGFKVLGHQPQLLVVSAGKYIPGSPVAMQARLAVRQQSRVLLWEAGAHPALGPPSGAKTIGAVF